MVGRKRRTQFDGNHSDNQVFSKSLKYSPSLNSLPIELFLRIIRHLDSQSVLQCRSVCKRWQDIINEDVLFWKRYADECGISSFGLPERVDDNSLLIVDAIQSRLRNIHFLGKTNAVIKCNTPLVGIENNEGVLIHWNGKLLFYRLRGIRLHQFLESLDDCFDYDQYLQDLVFSLDYDDNVVDWCTSNEQIHIFNGDSIESWEFGSPPKKLSKETLHKSELIAQSLSFHLFPKNIKIVKLAGRSRFCVGVSISFAMDNGALERVFIASRDSKTCIFHVDDLFKAEEIITLQCSLRDCGIHFMQGPNEKSVIVFMGTIVENCDDITLEIQSFMIEMNPKGKVVVHKRNVVQLACESSSNEIVSVGMRYIVLFDRDRKRLRYYLRPKNELGSILKLTFEIRISDSCDSFPYDWSQARFIFQDDVNVGMFGSNGIVKLYKCQKRAFLDFFCIHCT